jgi:hypothetical protein
MKFSDVVEYIIGAFAGARLTAPLRLVHPYSFGGYPVISRMSSYNGFILS